MKVRATIPGLNCIFLPLTLGPKKKIPLVKMNVFFLKLFNPCIPITNYLILLAREIIETYAQAIHELAIDLGRKLAKSMGLVSDLFKGWPCQFRINKYNFTPETVGSSGVQIHTDSGFLTILQDDENVGGLEVMDKSGAFVSVDPCPGTFLVNLGDVAKVLILAVFNFIGPYLWKMSKL